MVFTTGPWGYISDKVVFFFLVVCFIDCFAALPVDLCSTDPCQNGGVCQLFGISSYQAMYCSCPAGYFGKFCEGKTSALTCMEQCGCDFDKQGTGWYPSSIHGPTQSAVSGNVTRSWDWLNNLNEQGFIPSTGLKQAVFYFQSNSLFSHRFSPSVSTEPDSTTGFTLGYNWKKSIISSDPRPSCNSYGINQLPYDCAPFPSYFRGAAGFQVKFTNDVHLGSTEFLSDFCPSDEAAMCAIGCECGVKEAPGSCDDHCKPNTAPAAWYPFWEYYQRIYMSLGYVRKFGYRWLYSSSSVPTSSFIGDWDGPESLIKTYGIIAAHSVTPNYVHLTQPQNVYSGNSHYRLSLAPYLHNSGVRSFQIDMIDVLTQADYESCLSGCHAGSLCTESFCGSDPCLNSAQCIDPFNGLSPPYCNCTAGFEGDTCAINIDDCADTPCQNDGACTDDVNAFICTCVDGFEGDTCAINVDDCADTPCQNDGVCTDDVNAFICTCVDGFEGDACAINIDDCADTPCKNNGTCTDDVNAFICTCVDGFEGDACAIDIDDCPIQACGNGTCIDGLSSYSCSCNEGYTGSICDVDVDDCADTPCQNDGVCVDTGVNAFACKCLSLTWGGELCNMALDSTDSIVVTIEIVSGRYNTAEQAELAILENIVAMSGADHAQLQVNATWVDSEVVGEEGSFVVVIVLVASENVAANDIAQRIESESESSDWVFVSSDTTAESDQPDHEPNVNLILGLSGLGVVLLIAVFVAYLKYNGRRTVVTDKDSGMQYTMPV